MFKKGFLSNESFNQRKMLFVIIIINRDDTFKWKHRFYYQEDTVKSLSFQFVKIYLFTARFSTVKNFGPNFVDGFSRWVFGLQRLTKWNAFSDAIVFILHCVCVWTIEDRRTSTILLFCSSFVRAIQKHPKAGKITIWFCFPII